MTASELESKAAEEPIKRFTQSLLMWNLPEHVSALWAVQAKEVSKDGSCTIIVRTMESLLSKFSSDAMATQLLVKPLVNRATGQQDYSTDQLEQILMTTKPAAIVIGIDSMNTERSLQQIRSIRQIDRRQRLNERYETTVEKRNKLPANAGGQAPLNILRNRDPNEFVSEKPLGRSSRSYMIGWSSSRSLDWRSAWIELGFDFVIDQAQSVTPLLRRIRERGDIHPAAEHPWLSTFVLEN